MLVEIKVPPLAESVPDATCLEWYKTEGDYVAEGDNLIDLETDKVTLEITSPRSGILKSIAKKEGEVVFADEILALLDTEGKETTRTRVGPGKTENSTPRSKDQSNILQKKAGPAARKLMIENSLDSSQVTGTGKDNRITKEDVVSFLNNSKSVPRPEGTISNPISDRTDKRIPMTRLRKRVAEKLLAAQEQNALLTTFNEIDMTSVRCIRTRYKDEFLDRHDAKLGFMSFFVKAVVESLKSFPVVNASIDGDDVLYHNYFDIGVAVGGGKGLVVPVIKDADLLSFSQIEETIKLFAEKARTGKLTIEELTGGTFTISNGGIYGSLVSTPIINAPQSAILGMHKIQERPVVRDGEIVARPMMYIALTYDHRLIDGREAVQFLDYVRRCLEEPNRLLLGL